MYPLPIARVWSLLPAAVAHLWGRRALLLLGAKAPPLPIARAVATPLQGGALFLLSVAPLPTARAWPLLPAAVAQLRRGKVPVLLGAGVQLLLMARAWSLLPAVAPSLLVTVLLPLAARLVARAWPLPLAATLQLLPQRRMATEQIKLTVAEL